MLIVLLAAASSWLLLAALLPRLRRRLLDEPNARSSHLCPTPRGGGVVFVFISLIFTVLTCFFGQVPVSSPLPLLASPLAVVGLLDDRYGLPALLRYGFQLLTAGMMLFVSPLVQVFVLHQLQGNLLFFLVLLLLLISVTAVINFTNFMDGLDGLVGGCMAVAFAALAVVFTEHLSLLALLGSLLGFLLWNWSPAKVFMGDVGSTFLGAVFAGLVLQAPTWLEAFGFLLVVTPLIGDASLCVARRFFSGQSVFKAHRLHLFQRLHQAGWTHARVSSTYIIATALLALAMFWGGLPWVLGFAVLELLVGLWLDQRVAVPFAVASES